MIGLGVENPCQMSIGFIDETQSARPNAGGCLPLARACRFTGTRRAHGMSA